MTQTFQISITNEQQALPIDEARLREAVAEVLRQAGAARASVSVAVVDDPMIHALNRQYLDHDYPTDVLSFPLGDDAAHIDGEIVVSADTAMSQATEYGWPAADELLLYVIHGALHLVGYDDKSDEAAQAMREAERRVLAAFDLKPPT